MTRSSGSSQTSREPDYPVDAEAILALPPSAKLVLKVLEVEGTMTQPPLANQTRLSPRTVRDALDRLEEIGLVERRPYFRDARQSLYSLTVREDSADEA